MNHVKINLGCGKSRIEGFLSVDADPSNDVDIVANIDSLPFEPGSVQTIYCSHVLEHFVPNPMTVVDKDARISCLLEYWRTLLAPGGELFLAVPDFERLAKLYVQESSDQSLKKMALDAIFGGQRNSYDFHYSGFSRSSLSMLLGQVGFQEIEEFTPFVNDETQHRIGGVEISLNLKARKRGTSNFDRKFIQPELHLDELTILRQAADERLVGMIEQKKYIDYLENKSKLLEQEFLTFKNSTPLLTTALIESIKKKFR